MTTVNGHKAHGIEIFLNTVHMYSSYGLPIVVIPNHEMGRFRDYRYMKWRITGVFNNEYWL